MIRHRYTLEHIVKECNEQIQGTFISDCFTQEKNVLMLECTAGRHEIWLECSVDAKDGAVFLKKDFARAKRNSMDFFSQLIGQQIRDITLHPTDRIICIRTTNFLLYILCFSGGSGNILLFNAQSQFITSFKPKQLIPQKLEEITGILHGVNSRHFHIHHTTSVKELENYLSSHFLKSVTFENIFTELNKALPELGKQYCEYIIAEYKKRNENNVLYIHFLCELIINLYSECHSATKFLCLNYDNSYIFSLINLGDDYKTVFESESVSDSIRRTISLRRREQRRSELLQKIRNTLEQKLKRLQRTIDLLENEEKSEERLSSYKLWAELLISQENGKIKPSEENYKVKDWSDNEIYVPVSTEKTLIENAEHYYGKIRNAQQASRIRKQRLPKYKSEFTVLNDYRAQINNTPSIDTLEFISQQLSIPIKKTMETGKENSSKFRTFALEGGFTLYVGKSAANNDELTMKFAKQNDLWFHARGVSGSHAVLRISGKDKPTKKTIEQAAEIAAYYSSARNASYTPVAYTEKKYIRKPKGANPGAVIMEREKVIMVSPKLPVGSTGDE